MTEVRTAPAIEPGFGRAWMPPQIATDRDDVVDLANFRPYREPPYDDVRHNILFPVERWRRSGDGVVRALGRHGRLRCMLPRLTDDDLHADVGHIALPSPEVCEVVLNCFAGSADTPAGNAGELIDTIRMAQRDIVGISQSDRRLAEISIEGLVAQLPYLQHARYLTDAR